MSFAQLQTTSHFSFLRGASSCEELFMTAAVLGIEALAVTDCNSLAGSVRAHQAAKATGVRSVVGCRLDLREGFSLLAYPTDRAAYGRLCRLLSLGKGRAGKGACDLAFADVEAWGQGLIAVLLPDGIAAGRLERLREVFGDRAYLGLDLRRRPGDAVRLARLDGLARAARMPTLALHDVLYHVPGRRPMQDVVTCIREGCTIEEAGFRLEHHADRYLLAEAEMARLFARHPDALARTAEVAQRSAFSLDDLRYQYPEEILVPGLDAQQALETLTREALPGRYPLERCPDGVPPKVAAQIEHEFRLIRELGYAPYFLTVYSIVRFARSQGILCQGRGSAANSAVCYALGITSVDPGQSNLLFERFVSQERQEPPDIDVDFEHERREEVIQWIYGTYGRTHAALTATVIRYRRRGAVREVGKVFGLSEDVTAALATLLGGWGGKDVGDEDIRALNLDPADRRLALTLRIAGELVGTPRHLSQHPGGFVLTRDRLDEIVPIEPAAMADRHVIEWDKDDIDALRMMKVDVLGLGMLGCLRRCFDLLETHHGLKWGLADVPKDDAATYAMIRKADTIGVFQIESRAQMSMLPRLRPKVFYDLVIEVAIVRPGPIQGDMVHPYLRRRDGLEKPDFPKPELEAVLGKTLGVPLFQEQAMRVAIDCAGFTPGEADRLRRAMATFKQGGDVGQFRERLISGMVERGYDAAFAERIFAQLKGFGSYGFPESHATSFAQLAYISSWLKCHHPAIFCCAILNAQPMGFYPAAQLVRDARQHGVEVRPVSINHSRWDCTIEPAEGGRLAVRLGLRLAKGLGNGDGALLAAARGPRPFTGVEEAWARTGLPVRALERLAEADGFHSLGLDRRQALWAIRALRDEPLPLFAAADARDGRPAPEAAEAAPVLKPLTAGGEVVADYGSLGLSLRSHPLAFLRRELDRRGIVPASGLGGLKDGARLRTAGLVLVRQKPGSAKGVLFITIEDESGCINLVVWPSLYDRFRRTILSAGMIGVRGRLQREGEVTHVVADELTDLSDLLRSVGARDGDAGIKVATRDFR